MKNVFTFFLTVVAPLIIITIVLRDARQDNIKLETLREQFPASRNIPVDHSQHEILQQEFSNPHEITAACLSCHTGRGEELLGSAHFSWEREAFIEGKGVTYLGKKNLINNFCTGILSNEASCNRCHIGYGWDSKDFDFTNKYNVDCLVCHDQTGLYEKARGGGGYPVPNADDNYFRTIVQHVGRPGRENCGYCHFHGGGGNNVKHGDLEMALVASSRQVDVHMGVDGANMVCTDCHVTTNHNITGRYYGVSSENTNRVSCEQCHTEAPHLNHKLNEHVVKVACQTCHIPVYAKVNATMVGWDWSTAARQWTGVEAVEVYDSLGNALYLPIKGDFQWKVNARPEYFWFNGTADHHLADDPIDMDQLPLKINTLFGHAGDAGSRIIPAKVHRGRQPYDSEYKVLLQTKLWDAREGNGALWIDMDWEAALKAGMSYLGRPYSGKWDFVPTKMFLPVNHMVSPADQALGCSDCHSRSNSRLEGVPGIYMPATTRNKPLDYFGIMMIALSIAGVGSHALLRYFTYRRRRSIPLNN